MPDEDSIERGLAEGRLSIEAAKQFRALGPSTSPEARIRAALEVVTQAESDWRAAHGRKNFTLERIAAILRGEGADDA